MFFNETKFTLTSLINDEAHDFSLLMESKLVSANSLDRDSI